MLSEKGRILNETNNKQCATFKLSWKNITVWYPKKVARAFWSFWQKRYIKVLNNGNVFYELLLKFFTVLSVFS